MTEEHQHTPLPRGPKYDEHLALQRLEQLRRDIQTARWRREQAAAEFDAFIASFREPAAPRVPSPPGRMTRGMQPQAEAAPPRTGPPPAHEGGPTLDARSAESERDKPQPMAPIAVESSAAPEAALLPPAFPAEAAPWMHQPRKSRSRAWTVAAGAGLGALALAGFMLLRGGREGSPGSTQGDVAAAGAPSRTAMPAAPDNAPATPPGPPTQAATSPVAAPPGVVRLELVALRPVWIRVTVDGQRRIEREVSEGFRATLDAQRAVAIRAGDAGALMVGENGAPPAPLGREGQVATRIFPARAGR